MLTKRNVIAIQTLAAVVGIGALSWSVRTRKQQDTLVGLLRTRQLPEARAALNHGHDWAALIRQIELSHDPMLVQAAFDVQFEYWYSPTEDTNSSYTEHPKVIARLLTLGAISRFDHLLRATSQNKSETAWLLLRAGVPSSQAESSDTPLANAAYWGDMGLLAELLRQGADPNQPSAKGWRPVLAAAWSWRADCVRFLLDQGADVSLSYEVWTGNTQPIWKAIEERAGSGADAAAVWHIVRGRVPESERTPDSN